jgi:type I restriction enzyme S subunit
VDHIPAHWEVKRLKRFAAIRPSNVDKKTVAGQEAVRLCNYLDVYKNDHITDELDFMQATATASQIQTFQLRAGDVVITKDSESWDDIAVPAFVPKHLEGVLCGYHLTLIRPDPTLAEGEFLFRCFSAEGLCDQFRIAANGITRFGLDTSSINDALFPLPPLKEQIKIASFLDCETSKTDALIAKKQQLIELLKEKRQAVISHAVTKGLNPHARMKPSGIEWLGDVPGHWSVGQSRRLFRVRNEPALPSDKQLTASQKYGVLFQTDFVQIEGRRVVETLKGTGTLSHVEPNDFIISLRSFQGGIEWSRLRGSATFHYVVLVPVKHVHPPFFAYLFKSISYIHALRATADLIRDGQDLRYSHFVQVNLPLIPLDEQAAIAAFLDCETAKLDTLTAKAERAIELLQERRTALISAAVTGKIDVRGEAE